ncbi:MAG: iron ABC transporter permease [Bacteroidales bacterium]|nr:iron ABC transporter permease [Bacteroidales bacterium]
MMKYWLLTLACLILAAACLLWGSVDIPARDVWASITGGEPSNPRYGVIVTEMRLPMAITAAMAGAALAVAGLLLQTTFANPLAGPSILGISTGASLGVAVVTLGLGGTIGVWGYYTGALVGAIVGAAFVMMLLLTFSAMVKNGVMLLIIGIMIGYLASSAIALLNFFSTQEGVHSYMVWGLGTFSSLALGVSVALAMISIVLIGWAFLMAKTLNAMLLGENYARSLGVDTGKARMWLLVISGVLTAAVTAFCGPIGFLGLIVPHISRLIMGTSNHRSLLPATALTGAATGLLCAALSVMGSNGSIIPINAITPLIGAPVIIYIIIYRNKIAYFN